MFQKGLRSDRSGVDAPTDYYEKLLIHHEKQSRPMIGLSQIDPVLGENPPLAMPDIVHGTMDLVTDSVFDFKISRLAYAVVLVSVLLVVIMMGGSLWFGFLAVVPVGLAWWIHRLHTYADSDGIVAVGTFGEQSVSWDDVAGLRFPRWSSVRAVTVDGHDIRLPAVGFDDVPKLSAASGGRLPDPFAAEREARIATEHAARAERDSDED